MFISRTWDRFALGRSKVEFNGVIVYLNLLLLGYVISEVTLKKIIWGFPFCREDCGDYKKKKIKKEEKKIQYLDNTADEENKDFRSFMFSLEMLVTAKLMCIETNMAINLAWVKYNLQE